MRCSCRSGSPAASFGQLFLSFSLAVAFALIASLVVAVTVVPVLTRFAVAGKVRIDREKRPGDTRLGRLYTPVLKWSLANRWKTLGVAGGLFFASVALVPLLPVVFFPPSGENYVTINVNARPGQGQRSVLEQAIGVEELLESYDVEHYQTVITGAGTDIGAIGNIISGQGANSATISAELGSGDKQDIANELRDRIANELPNSENISVSATGGGLGPAEGIAFTIAAENASAAPEIAGVADQVAAAIAGVPDTANVATDVGATVSAVQVHVDSAAALEAGLSAPEVSSRLANLSGGRVVSTVDFGDGTMALRLTAASADLSSVESLATLPIPPGYLLGDIATFEEVDRQVSITRIDGAPAASVTADITDIDTAAVSADALSAVNSIDLPDGISVEQGGIAADINEGFTSMAFAILASIILVYAIMVLLFRSWLDPFVILFSLPLAVIGAIVALVITGSPLSISALIGVLMLVGIVVTNAIVMLEFVIMLRHERGYGVYEAIVEGAQTRLRPILMTAIAAMLALIPLSLGLTEGALIAADLGRVVIGGLFSSTLLTLVVVPVIYSLVDDLRGRFARNRAAAPAVREQEHA